MIRCPVPIIGFCAFSGTGKTTLLTQLIPLLKSHGLRIGVIKRAHHNFDIDHPGKDSFRLRHAGTEQMLIASERCIASIKEVRSPKNDIDLEELLNELDFKRLDLILVEGFKQYNFPKIELHRSTIKKPLIYPHDQSVIAVAADCSLADEPAHIPILDLNDIEGIAVFVLNYLKNNTSSGFQIKRYG